MEILVGFLIIVVVMWIAAVWLGSEAKRQINVEVAAAPDAVAAVVRDHFESVLWHAVQGPGMINMQSRGFGVGSIGMKNPTISIDISAVESGGSLVEMWMSAWESRAGVAASADRVYFKRKGLIKKLAAM